mmetsp:Transcript_5300/g.23849  ORF Transcript_5300/g.23849 Transcript_5300/m.23849 type:complete len:209 (-) Transcript_5300:616-1242(-)
MSAGLTAELDVEPLAVIRASRALGRLFVEFVLPGDRPGDLTVERFVPRGLVQRRREVPRGAAGAGPGAKSFALFPDFRHSSRRRRHEHARRVRVALAPSPRQGLQRSLPGFLQDLSEHLLLILGASDELPLGAFLLLLGELFRGLLLRLRRLLRLLGDALSLERLRGLRPARGPEHPRPRGRASVLRARLRRIFRRRRSFIGYFFRLL